MATTLPYSAKKPVPLCGGTGAGDLAIAQTQLKTAVSSMMSPASQASTACTGFSLTIGRRPGCSRTPSGPQEGAGTGADRPNAATEKSTFYKRNNSCNRTMDSKSTRDFQSIGVSQGGGFSNILAARIYLACLVGK